METFLIEILENYKEFWWVDERIDEYSSRMGTSDSDKVIFKFNEKNDTLSIGVTVFDGSGYKTFADKPFTYESKEGKLIKNIIDVSLAYLNSITANNEFEKRDYQTLTSNSEQIIRKYFS